MNMAAVKKHIKWKKGTCSIIMINNGNLQYIPRSQGSLVFYLLSHVHRLLGNFLVL